MNKHWTHYLPEAGTIAKEGDRQTWLQDEINDLQARIDELKATYKQNEAAILAKVTPHWTQEEISNAKLEAKG